MTERNPDAERLIALLEGRAVAVETFREADWRRIIELAQMQRVAPLFYARLKARGITMPPQAAERLRKIHLACAKRNLSVFQDLGDILRAFQAANIPVIPLKGACLAETVYGNIALRPMGDLDVLVEPANLAKALDVLRALGYVAAHPFEIETERMLRHHMPRLFKRDGLSLELHWTIVDPPCTNRFHKDDLDQVWARATPVKIAGVQVQMLSSMDLLWHLCLHASVQHRFDGTNLRNYWDIALVIQKYGEAIDWTQFTACVRQWGISNGVRLALQLTEEWTDAVVPSQVLAALETAPLDAETMDWVRRKILSGSSRPLKNEVARYAGKTRTADKLSVLRDVLVPSRVSMATKYHVPADSWRIFLHYPIRFKDLWTRNSQAMWQLLRRDRTVTVEALQEARLREYLGWN